MWTRENRGRMADIARKTRRYPSDLTDAEWERIEPLMPKPPGRGRKPAVDFREILNAIRYMARSAGGWRMLPSEFGPWQTVYWWFRRFVRRLLFRTIHDVALMIDREQAGREASPSGGVLDSQTVKAPFAEQRGYDGGKKMSEYSRRTTAGCIRYSYSRGTPSSITTWAEREDRTIMALEIDIATAINNGRTIQIPDRSRSPNQRNRQGNRK